MSVLSFVQRNITPAEVADLRFVTETAIGKTLEEFLSTARHPSQESELRMRYVRAAALIKTLEYVIAKEK